MAVRSKPQVCSRSITGISGSNPAEGVSVRSSVVFVVCRAGSGFCEELITSSEESYRMCVFNFL
jgi:hypothetical protein